MRKILPESGTTRVVTKFAYLPKELYKEGKIYRIWFERYKVLQIFEYRQWSNIATFLFEHPITDVEIATLTQNLLEDEYYP